MGDGGETRCLSDGHPGCGRRRRKHEGCLATVQARYTRSASQGVSHSTFGCHIRIGSAISSILRLSTVISPRGDAISSKRDFLLISPEKIINFPSFSYFETCLKKSAQRGRFCPASLKVFIRKQVGRSFSALCSIGQAIGSLLEESGAPSLGQGKGRSGLPSTRKSKVPDDGSVGRAITSHSCLLQEPNVLQSAHDGASSRPSRACAVSFRTHAFTDRAMPSRKANAVHGSSAPAINDFCAETNPTVKITLLSADEAIRRPKQFCNMTCNEMTTSSCFDEVTTVEVWVKNLTKRKQWKDNLGAPWCGKNMSDLLDCQPPDRSPGSSRPPPP